MKALILIVCLTAMTSIFAISEDMSDCGLGAPELSKSIITESSGSIESSDSSVSHI